MKRTYTETHPWITFSVDWERASKRLWLLLGEAASKCEHIAGVPLKLSVAQKLHEVYLAKGVLATTAIEGNTLSEEQVRKILLKELELPKSQEYLKREVENIIEACNIITNEICANVNRTISVEDIKRYNEIILKDLELQEGVEPGRIRAHSVGVPGYRGAPAEDCLFLLGKLCEWINGREFELRLIPNVPMGILKAIIAHLYIAWIHPFADGNGRTARIVEFKLLYDAGVPSPATQLLSNHYNATRSKYYLYLQRASLSGGDIFPFIEYALQGFVDGLREQLLVIRDQQLSIAWESFVHEQFYDKKGDAQRRRREFALKLAKRDDYVKIAEFLSEEINLTRKYARKTRKTLSRDIGFLIMHGMIEQNTAGDIKSSKYKLSRFLPVKKEISE